MDHTMGDTVEGTMDQMMGQMLGRGEMIKVVVIEDDHSMLAAIVTSLDASAECCCVGTAGSLRVGLQLIRRTKFDVALIDLDLGDGSGLELIEDVRQQNKQSLVLSVFGDEESVVGAVAAGADGYLLKDVSSNQLGQSIAAVIAGEAPISPTVAGHLLRKVRSTQRDTKRAVCDVGRLTPRETEVLEKLSRGYTYQEVGDQCGITYNTVSYHVKQIYEKLHVNSRSEAIYKAVNGGIIQMV